MTGRSDLALSEVTAPEPGSATHETHSDITHATRQYCDRLIRQLRIAVARNDRAAVLMLNARLVYSSEWRPVDEPASIWTRRMGRVA